MSFFLKDHLNRNPNTLLLTLTGLFLFFLPIPHTLTIREAALFLSIAVLVFISGEKRGDFIETLSSLRVQAVIYGFFLLWLLFLALFVSEDALWALNEIKTQWVMGSLALFLGAGIATLARRGALRLGSLMAIIFWTLAAHVLAVNVDGVVKVLGKLSRGGGHHGLTSLTAGVGGLTIGPIDGSLLASLFFVLILSEALCRYVFRRRLIPVPGAALVVSFFLVAGASFFTGMRNVVEIPLVVAAALFILFFSGAKARKKAIYFALIMAPILIGGLFLFYRSDTRWAELGETFDLAMKQEDPARVLAFSYDFVFPRLRDNRQVNVSNFIRFTKYRVATNIIMAHPLGIGFGRNAFGHYLKARYSRGAGLNSDSSVFDMAVGAGLVGTALFGAFIFTILAMSFRSFRRGGDFYSLFLFLLIICFSARMVFDSVLRDHLLEIFLFVTGMLSTRVSIMGASPLLTPKEGGYRGYGRLRSGEEKMKAV